ncbi:MAG: PAS domain-containing sensor histidine kinase [Burkholderiaceae bacterium]
MAQPPDSDPLYEDAACGLLVTEVDGTILRANRTFCRWIGRPAGALVGARLQSLLTIGGRIFHQTHWAPLLKMQGSLSEVKLELVHGDGHKIPMVVNAIVRRRDGERELHELAVFSARDRHQYERELVLARERAEDHLRREQQSQRDLAQTRAKLELALDAAQLSQWSVELPGRVRRYAPEVALLLGHAQAQPVEASHFLERIQPEDRDREHAMLDAFLGAGTDRLHLVFRVLGVDGGQRWVAAWGRVRYDAAGTAVDVVGVLQDVTESQRQRALAEDKALLAEQTLGIVGHDLRNPLAAIQTGAEILSLKPLDIDQQRALAARLLSSTRRANRLIADLLDFTQARNGRGLRLDPRPMDAHAMAHDVVGELAAAHPARALRHVAQGDGRLVADVDRLAQALGNLVANALTYGSPHSEVVVTSTGLPQTVRLAVHNEGPPIDPALLPTIFEPMTRGASAGHQRSVGLGLYIVREIAAAHGGAVDCVSDAISGTTFVVHLPRGGPADGPVER